MELKFSPKPEPTGEGFDRILRPPRGFGDSAKTRRREFNFNSKNTYNDEDMHQFDRNSWHFCVDCPRPPRALAWQSTRRAQLAAVSAMFFLSLRKFQAFKLSYE